MSVTSQALHNGAVANAECLKCWQRFSDPTGAAPCPNCGEEARIRALATGKAAPQAKAAPAKASRSPIIGLFAFLFGVPVWLEGARTTRDGWVFGLNWVIARAGMPFRIPLASTWVWWAAISVMVALGWAYSRVELRWVPFRLPKNLRADFLNPSAWYVNRSGTVWLVWTLVLFTDVVTMFLGARQAGKDDPILLQQIAASVTIAWVYAIMVTFIPDRLIRFGWRSIRG